VTTRASTGRSPRGGGPPNPSSPISASPGVPGDGAGPAVVSACAAEATGDKARAKALLDRLAVNRPETQRILSRLGKVPVDISPRYLTAEQLEAEFP